MKIIAIISEISFINNSDTIESRELLLIECIHVLSTKLEVSLILKPSVEIRHYYLCFTERKMRLSDWVTCPRSQSLQREQLYSVKENKDILMEEVVGKYERWSYLDMWRLSVSGGWEESSSGEKTIF